MKFLSKELVLKIKNFISRIGVKHAFLKLDAIMKGLEGMCIQSFVLLSILKGMK